MAPCCFLPAEPSHRCGQGRNKGSRRQQTTFDLWYAWLCKMSRWSRSASASRRWSSRKGTMMAIPIGLFPSPRQCALSPTCTLPSFCSTMQRHCRQASQPMGAGASSRATDLLLGCGTHQPWHGKNKEPWIATFFAGHGADPWGRRGLRLPLACRRFTSILRERCETK